MSGPFSGGVHVLVIRFERLIVSNVFETLVADGANDVVSFVHPISRSKNVIASRRLIFAEERLALHVFWCRDSSEIEHARAQVHQGD